MDLHTSSCICMHSRTFSNILEHLSACIQKHSGTFILCSIRPACLCACLSACLPCLYACWLSCLFACLLVLEPNPHGWFRMLLQCIFNVLLNNVLDAHTPVGAENGQLGVKIGHCRSPKMTFFGGLRPGITWSTGLKWLKLAIFFVFLEAKCWAKTWQYLSLYFYGWVSLWSSWKNGQLGVKCAVTAKIGRFLFFLKAIGGPKWLFLLGYLSLNFYGWVPLWSSQRGGHLGIKGDEQPKMALFGSFWGCRGPKMACSNLFWPDII